MVNVTSSKEGHYLVIQADDFGMTRGVNRGIIDAFKAGAITNTTLLVTMPYAEDAVRLAAENPGLPVGLHLSLTNGRPVSPPGDVPSLVDGDGNLLRRPERVYPVAKTEHIQRELRAQLQRFLDFGLEPSHIDTHHEILEHPVVREVLFEMARSNSIPIRTLGREDVKAEAHAKGVPVPDWYRDVYFEQPRPPFPVTPQRIVAVLKMLKPGVTDLGCHIGYVDDQLAVHTTYVEGRQKELESLLDESVQATIRTQHIQLMSFIDLKNKRFG
jgi:predicted glycoside hydrolase/deacetylase ChbG (UPF0249 family)